MISIDVELKSKKWLAERNPEKIVTEICKKLIPLTELKKIFVKDFELEIAVSLVSDAQIKKINQQFRQKNKATDILSFPALDENIIRQIGLKKALKGQKYLFLGDVVIAYETTQKEALQQKKLFKNHLTHLILHSILHLIGHDHEVEEMADKMEKEEVRILQKLKIKNPYEITK